MKVNFENPPDWLLCNCNRCVAIRVTVGGSSRLPVCDCGTILAAKIDGLPTVLENCPECVSAAPLADLGQPRGLGGRRTPRPS